MGWLLTVAGRRIKFHEEDYFYFTAEKDGVIFDSRSRNQLFTTIERAKYGAEDFVRERETGGAGGVCGAEDTASGEA
jgi:hypothetical protein